MNFIGREYQVSKLKDSSNSIIDLDTLDPTAESEEARRKLRIAFMTHFYANRITHGEAITLRVWLGLFPLVPMADEYLNTDLALAIASFRKTTKGASWLVGAAMLAEDAMRLFTKEEQDEILKQLSSKNFTTSPS